MKQKTLDLLGFSAAGLCFIHCLIFPLLMILPIGLVHNVYIDLGFFLIGAWIVFRITRRMQAHWLQWLFWSAIVCIGFSVFTDLLFHIHLPLIHIGAVLLMSAHMIHFRKHKN